MQHQIRSRDSGRLFVRDIRPQPTVLEEGNRMKISVDIENVGSWDQTDVVIRFIFDGDIVGMLQDVTSPAISTTTHTINFDYSELEQMVGTGEKNLEVQVDNDHTETYGSVTIGSEDTFDTGSVSVSTCGSSKSYGEVAPGESFTAYVYLSNYNDSAAIVDVDVRMGGQLIGRGRDIVVNGLTFDDQSDVSVTAPDASGEYEVTAEVRNAAKY